VPLLGNRQSEQQLSDDAMMMSDEQQSRREDWQQREMRGEYVVVLDGGRPWGVRLHTATSDNNNRTHLSASLDHQQHYVTVAKV